eukprot:3527537-Prymnesium_polylepis.1
MQNCAANVMGVCVGCNGPVELSQRAMCSALEFRPSHELSLSVRRHAMYLHAMCSASAVGG